jgi:hypothetical protein
MRKLSFEQAKARFVHRYTMEHVPAWSQWPHNGKYYAPQFASDREWYENSLFPGESPLAGRKHCYTNNPTWTLGQWLDARFTR